MAEDRNTGKVEIQRNEVEDMLGRVPGWITRNGMLLFLLLIAMLLFGSWVFRYPDIKRARIVVTSVNPPADIEARKSGKIVEFFVANGEQVESGTVLAVIENPASYRDVLLLKQGIAFLDSIRLDEVSRNLPELRNVRLGAIQGDYAIFLKAYRDYMEFKRLDYHQKRIESLRSELVRQRQYGKSLSDRAAIAEEAYSLARRQYTRDADLFTESVVSEADVEKSHKAMLDAHNEWQEILSLVAENNISIGRIEEQIVDLELKAQVERSMYVNTLEESFNNLKAAIARWEQENLLVAPISGTVDFTRFWSENQNVKAGEKVLTIVPAEAGSMVGKISLPTEGAGKVVRGRQVNIKFDNYPHLEYGMVKGYVSNISEVPDDDLYTVEVELPDGLRTYYDKVIPFSQNMQGQAEILTDKMRLLERILNPIRSAITKQAEM